VILPKLKEPVLSKPKTSVMGMFGNDSDESDSDDMFQKQ